jgi:hypothetical protein
MPVTCPCCGAFEGVPHPACLTFEAVVWPNVFAPNHGHRPFVHFKRQHVSETSPGGQADPIRPVPYRPVLRSD